MSSKPVIFISAVSQELKSARQLVANTLIYLGYEPDWQDIFGTEQGDLREMLRRRIDASAGVVQLIGQCSGFEPGEPDAEFGRCSYTQFEVFYARQRGKKVWLLFLDDTYPADAHDPPPDEWRELQRAYRERMRAGSELYHPIKTPAELETATLKLRQELAELRRRAKRWAAAVLLLLVLVIGGVTWLKSGQHGQTQTLTVMSQEQNQQTQALTVLNQGQNQQTQALTVMSQEQQKMRQILRDLPQTLAQLKSPEEKEDDDAPQARAFAVLEKKYAFPEGSLATELPRFAELLLQRADSSTLDRANALFLQKKFADAERGALEAKEKALAAAGQPVHDAIKALELAGWSARKQIQYARALEHFHAAAALTSRERDSLEWARVQSAIAYVLSDLGRVREVAPILREVLVVRERMLGSEHPDTLTSRNSLAAALRIQGGSADAEVEHRAVLALRIRVLGPEHLDTLTSRHNLASALLAQGKFAEAEQELRTVLALRKRVLGPEDPDTLKTRNNLASVLRAQGKSAEAEQEHRAVLVVFERVLGSTHPDTLASRNNLANALQAQGKFAKAEQEHRGVLAVRERVLGMKHPDVFESCYNLAFAMAAQGKFADALAFAQRAREGREEVLGSEHPDSKNAKGLCESIKAELAKPWWKKLK